MKSLIVIAAALLLIMVPSQTTRTVWDGVYTEGQSKRGQATFIQNCSACHGEDFNGGEIAPALFGVNFMANWNGLTVGDLAERIRNSMPPDNPEKITREQRADIVTAILAANSFPTGRTELDSRTEVMKQIKIEMKK